MQGIWFGSLSWVLKFRLGAAGNLQLLVRTWVHFRESNQEWCLGWIGPGGPRSRKTCPKVMVLTQGQDDKSGGENGEEGRPLRTVTPWDREATSADDHNGMCAEQVDGWVDKALVSEGSGCWACLGPTGLVSECQGCKGQ